MKQHNWIFTILVILVCIACLFAGCVEKESASTTTPTTTTLDNAGPVEHKLNATMHCTTIKAEDLSISNQYEAELNAAVPVGTVLSLLGGLREDSEAVSLVYLHPDSITIHAESVYTHSYIQVLNQEQGLWKTAQCSTYANSGAMCVGTTYDPITNGPEPVIGEFIKKTIYSYNYNNISQRLTDAVNAFKNHTTYYTYTDDIRFYLVGEDGTVNFGITGDPLFVHEEPFLQLLPSETEN